MCKISYFTLPIMLMHPPYPMLQGLLHLKHDKKGYMRNLLM
jgi:hypothetical protein